MINKFNILVYISSIVFVFTLNCSLSYVYSQISGKVYDAETNFPLSDVIVSCGQEQSITDKNGNFSIQANELIIIEHIGYKSDTIIIYKNTVDLKIYLIPVNIKMQEIIIREPLQQNKLINIPSSISILRKQNLIQTGNISFLEKLNQLPGIYVHTGTLNTTRITIRGIGSRNPYGTNRVKAYYNDIPLTNADGTTNIEDIDPALINTVDIFKGPKSAVYGAGLGGIILLSGREYIDTGFHGTAAMEVGIFGTYKPALKLHLKKGPISVNTFYSFTKTDGFRKNSEYNRHSAEFSISHKGGKNETDFLVHLIDLKAYIPSSLNEETFLNNPEQAASNWLAIKGFEEYFKIVGGLRNQFYINSKLTNYTIVYANISNGYESRPFNILDDDTYTVGLKSNLTYLAKQWQVRAGFELINEKYNWKIFETNAGIQSQLLITYSELRNSAAIFTDIIFTMNNNGIIEAGISYNFQDYQLQDLFPDSIDQSGNYRYKPIPSPFIGINIPFYRDLHLYSSYSHGFSYPTVEETLLPDGQINTNLKPETGNCFDMGLRLNAFKGNLFVDVGIYLLLVNNLLVTERLAEDIFTGKNAGTTHHMGFESSAVVLLNKDERYSFPFTKFTFAFSSGKNNFENFIDDGIDYKGKTLPGIPDFNLTSTLEFKYSFGLNFSFQNQYFGKQFLDDINSGIYNHYNISHFKLGYNLKVNKNYTADIYFGINNLFNSNYASMILVNAPSFGNAAPRYYYPGQPRYFYGGLRLAF